MFSNACDHGGDKWLIDGMGFNATSTVFQLYTADSAPNHEVPGFLTPVLPHNSFTVTDFCLTSSMRGEKSPERMFAHTGPWTQDFNLRSLVLCSTNWATRPGGAGVLELKPASLK